MPMQVSSSGARVSGCRVTRAQKKSCKHLNFARTRLLLARNAAFVVNVATFARTPSSSRWGHVTGLLQVEPTLEKFWAQKRCRGSWRRRRRCCCCRCSKSALKLKNFDFRFLLLMMLLLLLLMMLLLLLLLLHAFIWKGFIDLCWWRRSWQRREGGRSNLKVLHSDTIQMSYNNFSLSEYTVPR